MQNKFFNLFSQDRVLNYKIAILVFLLFCSIFLQKAARFKEKEIVKLREDMGAVDELAQQIPELEARRQKLISRAGLAFTGVILNKENTLAIINGRLLRVGDEIGGRKIVEIKANSVVISDGKNNYELPLE